MKNKLIAKLSSIKELSKNEQKHINGGGNCGTSASCASCSGNDRRGHTGSSYHPCNSSGPYYQGPTNCANYCNSGGYCCW